MSVMKLALLAFALTPVVALANAPADQQLRSACASQNAPKVVVSGPNEFQFQYHQGKLRGEAKAGKSLPCAPTQFTNYVASLDPAAVMAANPTAAGKAPAKAK
jgi:hypothetical protein